MGILFGVVSWYRLIIFVLFIQVSDQGYNQREKSWTVADFFIAGIMGRGEKKEKEEQDSIDYVIEIDDEREITDRLGVVDVFIMINYQYVIIHDGQFFKIVKNSDDFTVI